MQRKARVFIVDDHPMVRELLAEYLSIQEDLEVAGTAESAPAAIAAIERDVPDVAVVDLTLKRGSGLELIKDLHARYPRLPIVVLSMHEELTDVERAFRAGALGYVMKRESTAKILDAIREVRAGRLFADRDVISRITARALGKEPTAQSPSELLSDRELEVFRRLGAGLSTREIAAELGVGFKSVQTYCRRIKEKLGLADARDLARKAFEHSSGRDHGSLYGG